jgi:chromosome segregation ATPase
MNIADFVEQEKNEKDKLIERLSNDNSSLKRENEILKHELSSKNQEVSDLQQQVTSLKSEQDTLRTSRNVTHLPLTFSQYRTNYANLSNPQKPTKRRSST